MIIYLIRVCHERNTLGQVFLRKEQFLSSNAFLKNQLNWMQETELETGWPDPLSFRVS